MRRSGAKKATDGCLFRRPLGEKERVCSVFEQMLTDKEPSKASKMSEKSV